DYFPRHQNVGNVVLTIQRFNDLTWRSWRERLNDLLEARIAAERVPKGEGLEHAVAGARRCPNSGLNDGAQLLDGEIFLARPRHDHCEIGAHYLPIERVARNRQ